MRVTIDITNIAKVIVNGVKVSSWLKSDILAAFDGQDLCFADWLLKAVWQMFEAVQDSLARHLRTSHHINKLPIWIVHFCHKGNLNCPLCNHSASMVPEAQLQK
ncbi:hypothetical protein KIN20_002986 [Parelaphostrongylus tenuis]|uniref:Uncharacterized protein n=1 Tax=Parelaphostrongylus tenuis TaxID=148309 RepID=A0AAD5LWL2_PARTN|nr:hypothetical protein KIN20_002986 [Parelaphostrongylus tenuis]